MAYIWKKIIGGKPYYYLRVSKRKDSKVVVKDVAYLGHTLEEVRAALQKLPAEQVRAAYKKLNRYLESNIWVERARAQKLKHLPYLDKSLHEQMEACRQHWQGVFQKHDSLTRRDYFRSFTVEFAYNTTSIEGNTITLGEAARLLIDQLTPKDHNPREIFDLQNTERVFLDIVERLPDLTHETIIDMHRQLLLNIDFRTGYRTHDVHVVKARFESSLAQYVQTDMNLLLTWYREHVSRLHPFTLAAMFHHKFEKIHPFLDGNGRTGRMLMNLILLKHGFPPLIVRQKTRELYREALNASDETALTEGSPTAYQELIEYLAVELINSYWNTFL